MQLHAGSDLDGDEYSVIFDRELMLEDNEEAMVFPKAKASECPGQPTVIPPPCYDHGIACPVETRDMVDFFLKYVHQDAIGRVSNAHLMAADRLSLFQSVPLPISDLPLCSEIADAIAVKCAQAVDFPKTGEPAQRLTAEEMSDVCPDYMQNRTKPSYRSKRLIGQLYRQGRNPVDRQMCPIQEVEESGGHLGYRDAFHRPFCIL